MLVTMIMPERFAAGEDGRNESHQRDIRKRTIAAGVRF